MAGDRVRSSTRTPQSSRATRLTSTRQPATLPAGGFRRGPGRRLRRLAVGGDLLCVEDSVLVRAPAMRVALLASSADRHLCGRRHPRRHRGFPAGRFSPAALSPFSCTPKSFSASNGIFQPDLRLRRPPRAAARSRSACRGPDATSPRPAHWRMGFRPAAIEAGQLSVVVCFERRERRAAGAAASRRPRWRSRNRAPPARPARWNFAQ